MEPVVTFPYSEFRVAERLSDFFKKQDGYSVLLPSSRTEKAYDLALLKQKGTTRAVITIQVKASRTYDWGPTYRFAHRSWFQRFSVTDVTDWFILFWIYPNIEGKDHTPGAIRWHDITLCFSRKEMADFLGHVKTKKGTPDKFFAFGFDNPKQIYLTRGAKHGEAEKEYSPFLLENQALKIRQSFS